MVSSLDKKDNILGSLRDTTVAIRLKAIITNIEKVSKNIEGVVQNLNSTIDNANQTIDNVKSGDGLISHLSNDPNLVKKIDHTLIQVDSAVFQINNAGILLNQNLEALKHNWLLRGYFEKLEKEKLKAKDQKLKKN